MQLSKRLKDIALAALISASAMEASACTNLIVGKKASVDGSVLVSYNADDYGMFGHLCHYPAGMHKKGEMRKIFDWDTGEYHGEIPEAPVTYNVIGNINEFQYRWRTMRGVQGRRYGDRGNAVHGRPHPAL